MTCRSSASSGPGTAPSASPASATGTSRRFDLLALIAEGDLVVAHMPYAGTHRGAILGIEPTNRSCSVDEIVIFRLRDGKIAEAWEVYDEAGMWRQLGTAPPG
jgi:predicted ester cyclase